MIPTGNLQRPMGFRPWEISALFNEEVVEQHAEEAAFLWLLRDSAVRAPNYHLHDLADLDERVEANLAGLRLAGDLGWKYCAAGLEFEEPGEVFAAGVIAFLFSDKKRMQNVLEAACTAPELERALGSALGWLTFEQVEAHARALMDTEDTEIARIGLTAFALHRQDPGPLIGKAMEGADSRLRARAFKAIGELGQANLAGVLPGAWADADETCRFYAAWSAARLGLRNDGVFLALQKIVQRAGAHCEQSSDLLMRCLDIQMGRIFFKDLVQSPQTRRGAVIGAGALGDPQLVDELLVLMQTEALARKAGEAFSMITGVDFEYEDLDGEAPEGFEGGPSEAPEDEEVDLDADENLPWPDVELIKQWWQTHRGQFRIGKRYLRGKEMTRASLEDALLRGTQPQRTAAAIELAVRQPLMPLFETRAPGKRQLAILS